MLTFGAWLNQMNDAVRRRPELADMPVAMELSGAVMLDVTGVSVRGEGDQRCVVFTAEIHPNEFISADQGIVTGPVVPV